MAVYNVSNLTGQTNLYQFAFRVSQIEPLFGGILLGTAFFIILLSLNQRFNFISSLVTASFITSVAALLMRSTGLIGDKLLLIFITMTGIAAFFALIEKQVSQSST